MRLGLQELPMWTQKMPIFSSLLYLYLIACYTNTTNLSITAQFNDLSSTVCKIGYYI